MTTSHESVNWPRFITYSQAVITVMIIVFFSVTFVFNFFNTSVLEQFSYLAHSFLQGKLYFIQNPGSLIDTVYFHGHYYWPLGPFPAVLLIPLIIVGDWFGIFFHQGYLLFFITILIFFLCYQLARWKNFTATDSLYLAFAFCFASTYHLSAMNASSWYYAQAVAVALLLLSLKEYSAKNRPFIIGCLLGLTLMTRLTAGLAVTFFIADILMSEHPLDKKIKHLMWLLFPVAVSGLLLVGYNAARFDNPIETGYSNNSAFWSAARQFEWHSYGTFQLRNIPTNFYYYFIKTVDPVVITPPGVPGVFRILRPPYVQVSYPGVGFFVVAPIFLYIFRAPFKNRSSKLLLIPIILTLIVVLSFAESGFTQIGPRYTLDFLPFLYILLLAALAQSKLSIFSKIVVVVSAYINLFLLMTLLGK